MHVKDEKVFDKVDQLIPIILQCEQLFTEINLDELVSFPAGLFNMPDGQSISQLISPKAYDKTQKILQKSFSVDIKSLDHNYPLLVVNRLAESVLSSQRQIPLDSYLWLEAKSNNISRAGLESVEGQFKVLQNIPIDFQLKQLIAVGRNVRKFRKLSLQLLKYYQEQNIRLLYHHARKSMGKYRKTMIYDRNLNMAEAIDNYQSNENFYVVGAAHLYGNYGLLSQLKKRNWKINRIDL